MSKLRSVSTNFWTDPFIEDLSPNEKLLFLYLITNPKTNMLGVYEVSIKKMSYETGLNKDVIEKALKGFERLGKVKYVKNHIVLLNFLKHQNFNPNMKKSAIDIYNSLPNDLKDNDLEVSKDDYIKGFERLSKALLMVRKIEIETEYETKEEIETKTEGESKKTPSLKVDLIDNLVWPYNTDNFKTQWAVWKKYKNDEHKFKFKSTVSEQAALKVLSDISGNDEQKAIDIIHQSIANGWSGLFELKNQKNGSKQSQGRISHEQRMQDILTGGKYDHLI